MEAKKCPNCGKEVSGNWTFCGFCGYSGNGGLNLVRTPSEDLIYKSKRGKNVTGKVAAVVIIGIIVIAAIVGILYVPSMIHNNPPITKADTAIMSFAFDLGMNKSEGAANLTIAKVIGGLVFSDTWNYYSNLCEMYAMHGIRVEGIHTIANQSLTSLQNISAENAIALLHGSYGITVTEYCYVHVIVTGFGYNADEKMIGFLKVGGTWYIGYATNMVDLGNF